MEVHHIGYMVKRMEKSAKAFQALGYMLEAPPVWDEGRKAYICFLRSDGGYCVELIEPAKDSPLHSLLKSYPNAPYHMCYRCDDLEAATEYLKKHKFMQFLPPAPAPAIGENAQVVFLLSASAGMVELLKNPQKMEAGGGYFLCHLHYDAPADVSDYYSAHAEKALIVLITIYVAVVMIGKRLPNT